MRIKNLTPFLVGTRSPRAGRRARDDAGRARPPTCSRRASRCACPRACRPSRQGTLTAEVYRDDDEERAGECLYPGDFADFKLHAEVMLRGTCHAPGGRPVHRVPGALRGGGWSKILRVVGPPRLVRRPAGAAMTEPLPFTDDAPRLRERLRRPGLRAEPGRQGRRHARAAQRRARRRARSAARGDRPEPAGFGPLNPAWPQRARQGRQGVRRRAAQRSARPSTPRTSTGRTSTPRRRPAARRLPARRRGDRLPEPAPRRRRVFSTRLPGPPGPRLRQGRRAALPRGADEPRHALRRPRRGPALPHLARRSTPVEEDDLADVAHGARRLEPLADAPLPGGALPRRSSRRSSAIRCGHRRAPARSACAARGPAMQPARVRRPRRTARRPDPDQRAARASKLGGLAGAEQAQLQRRRRRLRSAMPGAAGRRPEGRARAAPSTTCRRPRPRCRRPRSGGPPPRSPSAARSARARQARRREGERRAGRRAQRPALDAARGAPRRIRASRAARSAAARGAARRSPARARSLRAGLSGRDLRGRRSARREPRRTPSSRARSSRAPSSPAPNLERAVLAGADLTGADLTGADLTLANLAGRARRARLQPGDARQAATPPEGRSSRARSSRREGRGRRLPRRRPHRARTPRRRALRGLFDGAIARAAPTSPRRASLALPLPRARARRAPVSARRAHRTSFAGADLARRHLRRGARRAATIWLRAKLDARRLPLRGRCPRAHFIEASGARRALPRRRPHGGALLPRVARAAPTSAGEPLRRRLLQGARSRARASPAPTSTTPSSSSAAGEGCDFTGANLARALPERT